MKTADFFVLEISLAWKLPCPGRGTILGLPRPKIFSEWSRIRAQLPPPGASRNLGSRYLEGRGQFHMTGGGGFCRTSSSAKVRAMLFMDISRTLQTYSKSKGLISQAIVPKQTGQKPMESAPKVWEHSNIPSLPPTSTLQCSLGLSCLSFTYGRKQAGEGVSLLHESQHIWGWRQNCHSNMATRVSSDSAQLKCLLVLPGRFLPHVLSMLFSSARLCASWGQEPYGKFSLLLATCKKRLRGKTCNWIFFQHFWGWVFKDCLTLALKRGSRRHYVEGQGGRILLFILHFMYFYNFFFFLPRGKMF